MIIFLWWPNFVMATIHQNLFITTILDRQCWQWHFGQIEVKDQLVSKCMIKTYPLLVPFMIYICLKSSWCQTAWGLINQRGVTIQISWDKQLSQYDMYHVWYILRADTRFAVSQWQTTLLCDVSHWLGANFESALSMYIILWYMKGRIVSLRLLWEYTMIHRWYLSQYKF